MEEVYIHAHALKHGVSESDIEHAWINFVRKRHRGSPHEEEIVVIGCDLQGRLIELVAKNTSNGTLIYHALRPPTLNVLSELGLSRRKHESHHRTRGRRKIRHFRSPD